MLDEKALETLIDQAGRLLAAGWRGNPHMSGDDRNCMSPHQRRTNDDKARALVEFILAYESAKQKGEAEEWRSISDEPLEALAHARTTAANDDMSKPGTVERERHCQRIAAMQSASEEIVKLRAMLSAGGEG